jgi:hypothetical protein
MLSLLDTLATAVAEIESTLGVTHTELEHRAGVKQGTVGRLLAGQSVPVSATSRLVGWLESQLPEEGTA